MPVKELNNTWKLRKGHQNSEDPYRTGNKVGLLQTIIPVKEPKSPIEAPTKETKAIENTEGARISQLGEPSQNVGFYLTFIEKFYWIERN